MNNSITCISCKYGKFVHKRATKQQTIFTCWKTGEGKERLSWHNICEDFTPKSGSKVAITSIRKVEVKSISTLKPIESYLL